jgi:chromosome partitioning protein
MKKAGKIISIANQKGGVGKSTTAQALWQGVQVKGFKSLIIDLDPQGNTTFTAKATDQNNAHDLLTGKATTNAAIQKTECGDIISSGNGLSGLELELTGVGKEFKLKEALDPLRSEYDYIVIDSPPGLGLLTVNSLTASDYVVIPALADAYSLQGMGQLYETIKAVQKYCNPNLTIKGVLLTRHNSRSVLSRDMTDMIEATAERMKATVFKTIIREGIAVKEAQAIQQSLFAYAPKSNPSKDYMDFIDELLRGI